MNDRIGVSVLQITDLHLFAEPGRELLGVVTDASADAVLEQALRQERPDALLVTGDVTQDGSAEGYRRARELVDRRFDGPSLWLEGNHDIRAAARSTGTQPDVPTDGLRLGCWQIVAMDTHVDEQVEGHVGEDEIERVDDVLRRADSEHVLICGHHPPIAVGTPWLDTQRIDNADALLAMLARHRRVRGYLFGHVHQPFDAIEAALRMLGTPSTCFQFEAGSQQFAVDGLSPGYRWLTLHDDGSIESRVERVARIRVKPIRRKRGY